MDDWKEALRTMERVGHIQSVQGLHYVSKGPPHVYLGEVCEIFNYENEALIQAEVTGFNDGKVFLMPYEQKDICMGYPVRASGQSRTVKLGTEILGRVLNAFAKPIDGLGGIRTNSEQITVPEAINPLSRAPITEPLVTGIHVIDSLFPIGRGQRVGIFAGSGVGKSTLLGRMMETLANDINVLAFIGERGREVKEFITHHLSEKNRSRTVIIAACSDDSALLRTQAVYTATAIARYFCEQGKHVSLFVDSMTRFAMAQREIGLSLGEPPTSRGYTPSCFAKLPAIIEQAGSYEHGGTITGIYTVLVEGDDFNEPVADHMRALLDGHIVLDRELAHQGRYPAIDLTRSLSRLQTQLLSEPQLKIAKLVLKTISIYMQNREIIELGAWQKGQNIVLDKAIERIEPLYDIFYAEDSNVIALESVWSALKEIVNE